MKSKDKSNKKVITAITAAIAIMIVSLSGCGEWIDKETVIVQAETQTDETEGIIRCIEGCTCDCICCRMARGETEAPVQTETPEQSETMTQSETPVQSEENTEQSVSSETAETESVQEQTSEIEEQEPRLSEIEMLSEGELEARREQQANFAEARETLYSLKNSKDKTLKINQMDRQILANNTFDFTKRNVVFIGDSITEGITSAVDGNGNFVSYVTYANSYLHFNRCLNHGKGGRMFTMYGDEDLSLAMNFGNVTNVDSDIIVVFAGVNDYLCTPASKRFGNVNDKMSTAGYCGAVRYFMKQLKEYYGDRDIFFVTMYNNSKKAECTYTDVKGQPTLNDYMEVQRKLAEEYGFNIIELYDIGFMDCTDKETADYYLRDGLHPKDNGSIALGEHIAAELSLYFGRN